MNRFYWNQYEYLALQHSNWLLSYLKQRFLRSLSCSCTTSYNMNIGVVMLVKSIWPENASQSQTTCCVYLDILLLHYTGCNCRNKLKSCLNFVVFPSRFWSTVTYFFLLLALLSMNHFVHHCAMYSDSIYHCTTALYSAKWALQVQHH